MNQRKHRVMRSIFKSYLEMYDLANLFRLCRIHQASFRSACGPLLEIIKMDSFGVKMSHN